MERETIVTLGSINRHFYTDHAEDFNDTRRHPWHGWQPILEKSRFPGTSVLDVGCGNGRFLRALAKSELELREYVGIDTSISLLSETTNVAKESDLKRVVLYPIDLSLDSLDLLPAGPFELIVAFGILHHIPSRGRRMDLLNALQRLLSPKGLLAISIWNFATRSRFSKHFVRWDELEGFGFPKVKTGDLDEGDYLLRWGAHGLRYCHQADADEISLWRKSLEAGLVAHYHADGKEGDLNEYLIFERN